MARRQKKEAQTIQAICIVCNRRKQASRGIVNNKRVYRAFCTKCHLARHDKGLQTKRKSKIKYCEECGFKAVHTCQLDVDHIDGDRNNNDPSNFKTLCSNCHRLKSFLNKDHLNKYIRNP